LSNGTIEPPEKLGPSRPALQVMENVTVLSGNYDCLLVVHSNYDLISYRFQDRQRFRSRNANFYYDRVFNV